MHMGKRYHNNQALRTAAESLGRRVRLLEVRSGPASPTPGLPSFEPPMRWSPERPLSVRERDIGVTAVLGRLDAARPSARTTRRTAYDRKEETPTLSTVPHRKAGEEASNQLSAGGTWNKLTRRHPPQRL